MKKRVYAICSGSGGVGKSTLATALALGAATAGRKTILLDAAGASRSCDLLLGMEGAVALDLTDVLCGEASIEHALYSAPQQANLSLCCASLLGNVSLAELTGAVLALRSLCDTLVIDLPTGGLALEAGLLGEGDVRVLLARPDDASLRAAERMLMQTAGETSETQVVLSRTRRELVKKGQQYAEDTAMQILDRPILGSIPEDDAMAARVGKGRARLQIDLGARAQLQRIVKALLEQCDE